MRCKIDALSTSVNLGVRPDNEGLAAVLGYLQELVASVPSRIGDATESMTAENRPRGRRDADAS